MPEIRNSQPMMMVNAIVAIDRHQDRDDAEKDEHDALSEKQPPVFMDGVGKRAAVYPHPGSI